MHQRTNGSHADVNLAPATFAQRLVAAGQVRGRLCVGIDPHPYLLQQWGLDDSADGVHYFTQACVEAFADTAALVKPQVAFFERFGSRGFAVLEDALEALRNTGCLTVADAKRGDIGSTMAGYAEAWLGESSPLRADSVTVSPYLGVGALQPVFDKAWETGRGVFVLAATSNPEAVTMQSYVSSTQSELNLAQFVVDECAALNDTQRGQTGDASASSTSKGPYGDIGVVVGATLRNPPELAQLHGPVLLPGVGAQGATAADVLRITASAPELGFANISRAVLSQGPNVAAMKQAVLDNAAAFMEDNSV
ncbi:MAG: orotidine-5'-phosphate decarboxylase [Corynebacterium sp.]|nr:orotidine-5'-phosphate decarboxylase [Corynebacterium sp.]